MTACAAAFKCEEVKGRRSVQAIKLRLWSWQAGVIRPSVHTFHSQSSVQRIVTLFNTVLHLCILHMSNLEAVIGQFCQDECLSKCP